MEHIASFGLEAADPTIPWPERGSAETVLCERDGWERRTIPIVDDGVETTAEAMVRGELAVNLMLGGEEGFAICLANSGWRISTGGRVYARCADAMEVVEQMLTVSGWSDAPALGYTDAQRRVLIAATDEVERRGGVMLDRVYPR